jgi:alanyl-tRNA synthetase
MKESIITVLYKFLMFFTELHMFTQTIRRQFLDYFKQRQHILIPSSPVVPLEDPTLLFVNAGMNQFKDVFLGKSHRDYTRAATSQKCIRAGGKHNDLENVGHTTRHLTFFEMLGNFSFGDYFKEQAIQFAWEVSTQVFAFDPERIWPTVFREDDEAFELWTKYVPAHRISRFDEKDNFWAMGETGPCGPCSELLYDRGSQYGTASTPLEDLTGERFLEFWNLVFMQFNRQASGVQEPLPKPSIDTGAGLERVVNLKMGVESVFETDVLRGLISQIEQIVGMPYEPHTKQSAAFRVIADHVRSLSFAIVDGSQPSNVDRGYVLRKILRRAVRYGRTLGMDKPFLAQLLPQLVATMGEDYPELVKGQERIAEILTIEEEAFIRTLRRGGNILNQIIEQTQISQTKMISGEDAFRLKDTYGLPIDEIALMAIDFHLQVDQERYQQLEQEAKQRSRQVHKTIQQVASGNIYAEFARQHGETKFLGYTHAVATGTIIGLMVNETFVSAMEEGQEGLVFLNETPFYAEMGGQVGDRGQLEGDQCHFIVQDCFVPYKGLIAHKGKLQKGQLQVNDSIQAVIDRNRRQKIANNHTATHLLHWALHKVLGEHIKQAGSVVDPERLRFDFSHHKSLSIHEIRQIEDLINTKIREDLPVKAYEIPYEEAQKREDIKQFFGEKYGNQVRVIDIEYSKELCGGTHTDRVGKIGFFRIIKESSIAAGIRRIEAVTGEEAEEFIRQQEDQLLRTAAALKVQPTQVLERIEKVLEENKQLLQKIKQIKQEQLQQFIDHLFAHREQIGQVFLLMGELPITAEELRLGVDQALNQLGSGLVALATVLPDKCQLMIKISDDWVKKGFSAQELIKQVAPILEGSGGGKAQSAQAGGKDPQKLPEVFHSIRQYVMNKQ